MDTSTFITIMPQGQLWALLNACWWASNIYATTGRILFYLLCTIISENYINIKIELDSLAHNIASDNSKIQFSAMADRLSKLADKYALVYECVEQLNISFQGSQSNIVFWIYSNEFWILYSFEYKNRFCFVIQIHSNSSFVFEYS